MERKPAYPSAMRPVSVPPANARKSCNSSLKVMSAVDCQVKSFSRTMISGYRNVRVDRWPPGWS